MADKHKIDFDTDDAKTYCQHTKRTARILGLRWWLFFVVLIESLFILLSMGMGVYLGVMLSQWVILKQLKKNRLTISTVHAYLKNRKYLKYRPLSRRRVRQSVFTQLNQRSKAFLGK